MMWSLHGYFLRELLKTFALALLAMTGMLVMAGGLYNVVRLEGITAADLLPLAPLLLPVAVLLAMPMAALLAGTLTYGRFAADNEFVACRAAGVNIHWMFASPLALAAFVTVCLIVAQNHLLPNLFYRVDRYARNNLRDIAARRLESRGFVDYISSGEGTSGEDYLLTADRVRTPTDDQLRDANFLVDGQIKYLVLYSPLFLQRDKNDNLVRYITAEMGMCMFDARTDPLQVTVYVHDAHDFEGDGSAFIEQQTIGPFDLALKSRQRPTFMDLNTLTGWLQRPWEGYKVRDKYGDFRNKLAAALLADEARDAVDGDRTLRLADRGDRTYALRAARVRTGRSVTFEDVTLVEERADGTELATYAAQLATLSIRAPRSDRITIGDPSARRDREIVLRLQETPEQPVYRQDRRAQTREELGSQTFEELQFPEEVRTRLSATEPARLLDPTVPLPSRSEELAASRAKLIQSADRMRAKIDALIHFRFGISLSILVTVVMGAALGVIFRGAQLLAAFGLAFVPAAAVVLVLVVGRSIGEKPGTAGLGIVMMWTGLVAAALLNTLTVRLGVKR